MSAGVGDSLQRAIRKSGYIIREEGLGTWLNRAARVSIVRVRRMLQNKKPNIARWKELKGRHAGQRAFLVGNGPSLNQTPMHLLAGEHVMCFNRFHLMFERLAWRPTFYAISDDLVAMDVGEEVARDVLPLVEASFFPDIHPYNVDFRKVIPARDNVFWLYLDRLDFSDELPYAGMNKTVANVGLQILAYLGFNPIYMIGVDMSYSRPESIVEETSRNWAATKNDDPNHFDPRYFGAGHKYHAPRMDETREFYVRGKDFYDARGVEIVNAGVGGELDVFPRTPFRELFAGVSETDELELILDAVAVSDSSITREEAAALKTLPNVDALAQSEGGWVVAPVSGADLSSWLKTHLIFGPMSDGRYLFVPRASGPAW